LVVVLVADGVCVCVGVADKGKVAVFDGVYVGVLNAVIVGVKVTFSG
jgi:hypothetical protein